MFAFTVQPHSRKKFRLTEKTGNNTGDSGVKGDEDFFFLRVLRELLCIFISKGS